MKDAPTVLIIEELSQERNELVNGLLERGYIVNVANNIDEATVNFQISQSDIIVLDFFVPDISKWKLLRAFRAKSPLQQASTLLITGVVSNVGVFGFKINL